jgi:hypothetical protein
VAAQDVRVDVPADDRPAEVLSDLGAATAGPAPRNRIAFDVAPISHAFETFPASERFYSFMNHEMVHIAQGDVANETDLRWRKFFLGKVFPVTQNPETLLYNYLTVPRWIAPRWYVEGSAVFFETWMGGGLGRAQGGYDEMVFRAMVRDGARFYDPLGLDAVGMRSVFQTGANAYLYGTRFMTWLAYTYGPWKIVCGFGATRAASAITPTTGRCSAEHRRSLGRLDRIRTRVPAAQPGRGSQESDHAVPAAFRRRGGIDLARPFRRGASGELYGAFRYPAWSSTSPR